MNPIRYFIKAMQIMSLVGNWSVQALEDGKVTIAEAMELVEGLCKILDIPAELPITDDLK